MHSGKGMAQRVLQTCCRRMQMDEQQAVGTLALMQIICGVVLCFGLRPALTAFRSWRHLSVPTQLSVAAKSGSLLVTTAS